MRKCLMFKNDLLSVVAQEFEPDEKLIRSLAKVSALEEKRTRGNDVGGGRKMKEVATGGRQR